MSQVSGFPFSQGTRERPSGRFPYDRLRPFGSLVTEIPTETRARATNSFKDGALLFFQEHSYRQNHAALAHQLGIHSGICVAHKEANPGADVLKFSLLRRQVSQATKLSI